MSDHNEEDVLDQGLPGSSERGMQTSGAGGSLPSQAPIASLELPASGDQQEQQQQPALDAVQQQQQQPDVLLASRAPTISWRIKQLELHGFWLCGID
jgi:hypothetical protein